MDTAKEAFVESLRAPLSYGNAIRDLHAATLALTCLALAVIGVSRGLIGSVIVCVLYFVVAAFAGVGRTFLLTYGRLALIAGTILFVARSAVLPGEHVLFRLGGLRVSTESILAAGEFTLDVLSICGAVILLFTIAPMKKIMLSLEQAGVTPKATFVILSSTQSITNLGRHSKTVSDAQESRGIEMKGSVGRRAKAFFAIISPVFLAGLNEVEERALALDARAFSARTRHTQLVRVRPWRPAEIAWCALALLVAIASVVGAVSSWF